MIADNPGTPEPSRALLGIIRAIVAHEDETAVTDELREMYMERAATRGLSSARRWLLKQTVTFVIRGGAERIGDAIRSMDSLGGDLRAAARSLTRNRAYALTFMVTLAVGTGVLATITTAANWVLFRPVPGVARPDEIVLLRLGSKESPRPSWSISHPDLITLRERLPQVEQLAASAPIDVDVRWSSGAPQRVAGDLVTANYFQLLETPLAAGRRFSPDDELEGTAPSAILSWALARSLTTEPSVLIGQSLRVNGAAVVVIGITARGFRGAELPGRASLWLPLSAVHIADPTTPANVAADRSGGIWMKIHGRMKPGTTAGDIAHNANSVMDAVRKEFRQHSYYASIYQFQAFAGAGLDPAVRTSVRRTVNLLALAAGLLLLLATANLVNLALMRASKRANATAVRYALGASTLRIARSVFAELLLLGLGGGLMALALAAGLSKLFDGAQLAEHGASISGMRLDIRVIAFTLFVALASAMFAGLVPLRFAPGRSLESVLRNGLSGGVARHRARLALASAQVAVSLVLLVTAGLLGRTVIKLRSIDLGFASSNLAMFALDPAAHGVSKQSLGTLGQRLEERIRSERGVSGVGAIAPAPFRSSYFTGSVFRVDGADRMIVGAGFYVSAGLLPALGARVLAGDQNWRADSGTIVLSRRAVKELLPEISLERAAGMEVSLSPQGKRRVRIAAVIEDLSLSDVTAPPPALVIKPLSMAPAGMPFGVLVRTSAHASSVFPVLRTAVADVAPDFSLFDVRTARSAIDLQFTERRILGLAAGVLAALGLLLSAVGLYGVLGALVAMQTREMGIRSALGASPSRIVSHVTALGLVPAVAGIVVGIAGATMGSHLLKSQVYGVQVTDALIYVTATMILLVAVTTACLVPALRAARVSPSQVLRND